MKIGLKKITLAVLCALPLTGCDFKQADLERWPELSKGDQRLAGYYFDRERPAPLRAKAARLLFESGHLGQIMGVVRHTEEADRAALLVDLSSLVRSGLSADTPAERNKAAELGLYLLEFHEQLQAEERGTLLTALTEWSLKNFNLPIEPAPRRKPEDLLLATWVVDGKLVAPKLIAWLNAAEERDLIAMVTVLSKLREAPVQQATAVALLAHAKKIHPKLSSELVDAMLNNGNETLLRYLVAVVADVRVEYAVRALAWEVASHRLGAKGLPQYLSLLPMDDPANGNDARLLALDLVVKHGRAEILAKALRALPTSGTWPTDGDELRTLIRSFCDTQVARYRVAARPVLMQLIDDANWVARAYAMECIIRLYPDDAPEMLVDLLEDETPLRGFSMAGETSFAEVVAALNE